MPSFPPNPNITLRTADEITADCRYMGRDGWTFLSRGYDMPQREFLAFVIRNWAHIFPDEPEAA